MRQPSPRAGRPGFPTVTTVTWTFTGAEPHNVVGDGWGRAAAAATPAVTRTFEEAGTYPYGCTLHLGMEGRVDVVPATSGASS